MLLCPWVALRPMGKASTRLRTRAVNADIYSGKGKASWNRIRILGLVTMLVAGLFLAGPSSAAFQDPLDTPAVKIGDLAKRPMLAAARAGHRLVAVGLRGVIIYSDDHGKSWTQSAVPVQSDLVAVYFSSPTDGWAVGHGDVILHSSDGGKTWVKQLDGREALNTFERYYEGKIAGQGAKDAHASEQHTTSSKASEDINGATTTGLDDAAALKAVKENFGSGPSLPFLDVWFRDAHTGYAVGSFGTLARTTDGGQIWSPAFEHIENPRLLNLNALNNLGGQLFIAGERGTVFRLDEKTGLFESLKTGYDGSFFGIAGSDLVVLAFGLQGTIYRSTNNGSTWQSLNSPTQSTISAGIYDYQAKAFVLVTVNGELLVGNRNGTEFTVKSVRTGDRYTGICEVSQDKYLVTGLHGVQIREPDGPQAATISH